MGEIMSCERVRGNDIEREKVCVHACCVYVRARVHRDYLSRLFTKAVSAERGREGVDESLETVDGDSPHCVPAREAFVGSGSQQAN